jgi:phage shock protein B
MTTVERLVVADHPEFRPLGHVAPGEHDEPISELERMLAQKKGARS